MKKILISTLLLIFVLTTSSYATTDCSNEYEVTLKSIECTANGSPGANHNVGKDWTIKVSNNDTFNFKTEDIGAKNIGASEIPSLGNILENDFVQQVNSLDFKFVAIEKDCEFDDKRVVKQTLIEHDNIIEIEVYETKDGKTICENIKPCIWQIIINVECIPEPTTEPPAETTPPETTAPTTESPEPTETASVKPTETPVTATPVTLTPSPEPTEIITTTDNGVSELPKTGETRNIMVVFAGILLIVAGFLFFKLVKCDKIE